MLTRAQKARLNELLEKGYIRHETQIGRCQRNKPLWALVKLGLAEFDMGPKGSYLQSNGFMPTEAAKAMIG